ncbi:hypothetical protein [Acinetobacter baumannii]
MGYGFKLALQNFMSDLR